MTKEFIQGSGGGGSKGGGGGSRTPTTDKDSLNNKSFANILDVISEGEIDGIHNPDGSSTGFHQSIFLNNTPLKNADGTSNFQDVTVDVRNGTPMQSVISGFNRSVTPISMGSIEISKNTPVTFTISDNSVSSVIIDIGVPALQKVNKDGDTKGATVQFKFQKQIKDGSSNDVSVNNSFIQTIKGRTGDLYQRQYEFDLSGHNHTDFPISFKVIRITDDDSTTNANSGDNLINTTSAIVLRSYQLVKEFDNPISGRFSHGANTDANGNLDTTKIIVTTTEPHTKVVGDSLGFNFINDGLGNNHFNMVNGSQTFNESYKGAINGHFQVNEVIDEKTFSFNHIFSPNQIITDGLCTFSRRLNYPNSALVGIKIDAEQFNSIPRRAFLINGIKVKIPASNGGKTPVVVRNATQAANLGIPNASQIKSFGFIHYPDGYIFNGNLTAAQYTNDPAWCLYDILLSERYGLGQFLKSTDLDIFSFYAISKYSSELVTFKDRTNDGNVVTFQEPRFSLNCVIQKREDAFKIVNNLCSVFRGMALYTAGSLSVIQDKKGINPTFLFNKTNVTPEGFTYSGTSQKTRANVAIIKYFDIELRDAAYEEVIDEEQVAKHGAITKNLNSFGVTSRTQARRLGRWFLTTLKTETETVNFTTTLEAGALCKPGQLIEIQDPVRSAIRRGGRILGVDTNSSGNHVITTDEANLPNNLTSTVSVIMTNGQVCKKNVLSIDTANKKITVDGKFFILKEDNNSPPQQPFLDSTLQPNPNYTRTIEEQIPSFMSIWVLETTGDSAETIQSQQFKIISVEEEDDYMYSITGISHNESKYDHVEQLETLVHRDITNLDEIPTAPERFAATTLSDGSVVNYPFEQLYKYRNQVKVRVIVQWKPVVGVNKYELIYNQDNKSDITIITQSPSFDIDDVNVNTATSSVFNFKVKSVSASGRKSTDTLETSLTVQGKSKPPSRVSETFAGEIDPHLGIKLSWTAIEAIPPNFTDLDIRGYIIKEGSNFDTGTLIGEFNTTSITVPTLPSANDDAKVYSIKAVDTDGNLSEQNRKTSVVINKPPKVSEDSITHIYSIDNVIINWTQPTLGDGQFAIREYEVFNGITSLGKVSSPQIIIPVNFNSDITIKIKTIDIIGKESELTSKEIKFNKTPAPNIEFTFEGSKLRLHWEKPTEGSVPIKEYEIRRSDNTKTEIGDSSFVDIINSESYLLDIDSTFVVGTAVRFFVVALDANGLRGIVGRTGIENYPDVVLNVPPAPENLTAAIKGDSAFISWNIVTPLSSGLPIRDYKIYREAVNAETVGDADFQQNGTQVTEKVLWTDLQQKYFVRAVDINGNEGLLASVVFSFIIPSAVESLNNEVIDNNVLLRWQESPVAANQLPIIHYNIYRNIANAANLVGQKQGTFTTVFENNANEIKYIIEPVNSANVKGTTKFTIGIVDQPPDFVLNNEFNSTFNGTIENGFLDSGGLFFNVDTDRTWKQHFDPDNNDTTRTFGVYGATTVYALPTENTGSYEEVIDTGAVIASTRIETTLGLDDDQKVGTMTITPEIFTSLDNNTYTSKGSNLSNVLGTNFRYIKIKYEFEGADNNDLIQVKSLKTKLFLKRKTDQGRVTITGSDNGGSNGVNVSLNETFVDVDSIQLSIQGTSSGAKYAIYDFKDEPNPDLKNGFTIFVFTTDGSFPSANTIVDFTVRGV